jgi:nitric oxide reductase activation protein
VVEESSSEEDNDESTENDLDEMPLFIRRFSKMMSKQKFFKLEKKDKLRIRTKGACYNCGKYDHYIANYPHEHRNEEEEEEEE